MVLGYIKKLSIGVAGANHFDCWIQSLNQTQSQSEKIFGWKLIFRDPIPLAPKSEVTTSREFICSYTKKWNGESQRHKVVIPLHCEYSIFPKMRKPINSGDEEIGAIPNMIHSR